MTVELTDTAFPTREYDGFTLPAGTYLALRVVIGAGEGHNWWCVMFPPMCLPAAQGGVELDDVLDKQEEKIVRSNPKYEPRFKIVEWIERLREYLRDDPTEDATTDYFTVTQLPEETETLSIGQTLFSVVQNIKSH